MPEMTVQDWLGAENQIGIDIWEKKYRYNGESFEQWLDRVSGGDPQLRQLIVEKKFLFGGRILASRGIPDEDNKVTYSNCYVITPPEDNIESIFDCAKKLARTFSYGGGCGIDISKLAPKGAKVRNAAKQSSGAVSFMDLYSMVTGLISQNGRRGALMISMDVSHPDILDFIDIKKDLDRVTKANTSVKVSSEFMTEVEQDHLFNVKFSRPETGEHQEESYVARSIFHKIAENNWDMGEPGILFWDMIKNWNLLSGYDNFEYAGVNPCAEEPLPAGGSCLLGSINLSEFVDEAGNFDFDGLGETVFTAVVALNRVLDEGLPKHPLEEQRESVRDWRQCGLGVMAIADMLIKMGVEYGSDDSYEICSHIAYTIFNSAVYASANLAAMNGHPFPKYDYESLNKSGMYQQCVSDTNKAFVKEHGMYNSQLLTIAPTGTLSTMLGISGGIEPVFANYYTRKTESLHGEDHYYKVYTPIVKRYMDAHGLESDEQLPEFFVTARDIPYQKRLGMQSVWQQYVDASISSTVNLPEDATVEDVEELYMLAWHYGLKGVTVFRENCRRGGILTTEKPADETKDMPEKYWEVENYIPRGYIIPAGDNLIGKKRKLTTGCGSLHCTAFFDPETGNLMETYLSRGSTGGCANSYTGLSRMISLAARGGVPLEAIVDQLNSCGICPSYAVRRATKKDTSPGACCPIAVGKALVEMHDEMMQEKYLQVKLPEAVIDYMREETKKAEPIPPEAESAAMKTLLKGLNHCPECGQPLAHAGGCDICNNCGWSHCN
jgi:ribonucleoside-diphosphate reductase alpha chain